ncbi:hypothetical protein OIO90_002649 [Microbotryomycetes sp. JL221]|nr:hypothetical protein OIO90_002649 [Microbotryomycetes sp. JL221]
MQHLGDDPRLLDQTRIDSLRDQIYALDDDRVLDLKSIAEQLVEHAKAVDNVLQRNQSDTSAKLEKERDAIEAHNLERKRWQAEKDQLLIQAHALAHKLKQAQQDPPDLVQDVDEYGHVTEYSRHLDSRNAAELRYAQRRLQDAEGQLARLQAEIKRMRPFYLHGAPLIAYDTEVQMPAIDESRPWRPPVLGDAEAEHLLLAGKTLSHVRRINRVPLSSAIVQQAESIVEHGHLVTDGDDLEATPRRKPRQRNKSATSQVVTEDTSTAAEGGHTPVEGSPAKPTIVVTPSRRHDATMAPTPRTLEHPTPGRLDDLLQAAQTVETGTPHHSGPSSVKRRRLGTGEASPTNSPWRPSTARALQLLQRDDDEDEEETDRNDDANSDERMPRDGLTALDVLAQASASQHATSSQSPPPDEENFGATHRNKFSTSMGPPPLTTTKNRTSTPLAPPVGLSQAASLNPPGPSGSGSGLGGSNTSSRPNGNPLAPGIDINSLGNGGTPKPLRSPYIKWNSAEDEMLLNAVIKHGLRWDQVSAEIPTRSYHQVRQRFLRGLKNGKSLPADLQHLADQVRDTVRSHEERKKEKKARSVPGQFGTPGTPDVDGPDDNDDYMND